MSQGVWEELKAELDEIETLQTVIELLGWDSQVNLAAGASAGRAKQESLLARLIHRRRTSERLGALVRALEELPDKTAVQRASARNLRRDFDRDTRVPNELVSEMAETASQAFPAWAEAKEKSDFSIFQPFLEKHVALQRRFADAIDPKRHPYDVLLDGYDPGLSTESLRGMFSRLGQELETLLAAIAERPQVDVFDTFCRDASQEALQREVVARIGYDFEHGALHRSLHPFTSTVGPGDVRITTYIRENDMLDGLSTALHEAGHGLYEQGLPVETLAGTSLARASSMGMHESQSRFWENCIGRSRAFMDWLVPVVLRHFPGLGVEPEQLFRAANRVERSLIRVQADEVTYNLHVVVRFELELALVEGRLRVADLPAAWNAHYEEHLGVTPTSDAVGVLQDAHWAAGAFAYFPSYTLGNLYARAFTDLIESELGSLDPLVRDGHFAPIVEWLRKNVHEHGHLEDAPDRMKRLAPDVDLVESFVAGLWARHGDVYGVVRPSSVAHTRMQ